MDTKLEIQYLAIADLKPAAYNPRKWDDNAMTQIKESLTRFGVVDPLILNSAPKRKNTVIGGHFRLAALKELGYTEVPVVYVHIPDENKEKELNLRLNKNTGEFDIKLLAEFDEAFLVDIGFSSEELDDVFITEDTPEIFDLKKELNKLNIKEIEIKKGEVWKLGDSKLMCGDSTVEADMIKLMDGEKAVMCFTDPPYILDYLRGGTKQKEGGFGAKKNRRYLETDVLPDNFTELWMKNISSVASENFSIIVYENWKNIRTIWNEMEKYWKVKNMIVWHVPNRMQGFAAKGKFFNKHDIAMVGATEGIKVKSVAEGELLENEYETALYAIQGKPHWESYEKGNKYCPTDFIDYKSADEKSSGQGVIFGTKPLEILIPYIKVLTRRGDLIVEPFGGSGSTLIAAEKMNRRCNIMEKSPVYAEIIRNRWQKLTGKSATRLYENQ